jgi:recombination protein RecR
VINSLIKAFTHLPGIGQKSATRFAYFILEHHKQKGLELSKALKDAIENVKNCEQCRTLTTHNICEICQNEKRDNSILCVVENPSSIASIEASGVYSGKYFVLGGYLSPIDGIGIEDIGLVDLENLVNTTNVTEIILATSASMEAEVTNHYIENMFQKADIKITKIARGIPLGGDLEYTDINTIAKSLTDRN